jgi:hypothetical protein
MSYILKKSDRPSKKFMIIMDKMKHHFGQLGAKDYTLHDKEIRDDRKKAYINRHFKRENWSNIHTSGFWSRWILWNKPTIEESIRDVEKRFNIKIKYER